MLCESEWRLLLFYKIDYSAQIFIAPCTAFTEKVTFLLGQGNLISLAMPI